MSRVTHILAAIEQGDTRAVDKLLPAVYEELRRLAAQKLSRERPGQTLQATALVHEAYLKLLGVEGSSWQSRTHFFSAAAEAMRCILIDNARRKKRLKRGGDQQRVDLDEVQAAIEGPSDDVLAIDEALAERPELAAGCPTCLESEAKRYKVLYTRPIADGPVIKKGSSEMDEMYD